MEGYNPRKKRKVLVVFANITEDIETNKTIRPIVTELFLRKKTRHFTFLYITSYFKVAKTIRLNATHYFIMKIPNKRRL